MQTAAIGKTEDDTIGRILGDMGMMWGRGRKGSFSILVKRKKVTRGWNLEGF